MTDWDFVLLSSHLPWGYSGVSSTDFIPHTALGPRQIYSYPWQALIRDLERDFAASSRISAISFFHPRSEKQQEGRGWDITSHTQRHFEMNRITQFTHTHTHRRIIIYSWHLLLGSLGSNALSYHSTKTASWLHWLLGHYATLDQQSQLVRLPAAPCLICFYNYTFFISPGLTQWHQRCL